VVPVFAVPKKMTHCTIAFLNPGLSYPYFANMSLGMHAAAKFYGVHFVETNLNFNYGLAAQQFRTIQPDKPAVIGVQTSNAALWSATQSAHLPLLTVDSVQVGDRYHMGVDNVAVGDEAADVLAPALKRKLAGPWSGKTLIYEAMSASDCPACDARVNAELARLRVDGVNIAPANATTTYTYPGGTATVNGAQEYFADALTANPNAVFVVASFGDEPVVGALQAAQAANRLGDIQAVSLGGDSVAVSALKGGAYKGVYLGAVAFNPYSEGWNWVAAAIAIAEHKPYSAYKAQQMLTAKSLG
jgi:ABC-type sugar transport system substrate-binding protein